MCNFPNACIRKDERRDGLDVSVHPFSSLPLVLTATLTQATAHVAVRSAR